MTPADNETHSAASAPWIVLVDRWRFLALMTFLVLVASVGAALLWPKTYRTVATLLVTPPRYSRNLTLPPAPLDMKTVESLANAYRTLQRVLAKVQLQRRMVGTLHERFSYEETGPVGWETLRGLSPDKAVDLAEIEDPLALEAWKDLPSPALLPGYLEFRDRDFEDLDPLLLSESLTTQIRTELENRVRVEYQPILALRADWRTARTSAIFAHVWAETFLRLLEQDYLSPTLERQDRALNQLFEAERDLAQAYEDYAALQTADQMAVKARRRPGLVAALEQSQQGLPSLLAEEDRLAKRVARLASESADGVPGEAAIAQAELEAVRASIESVSKEAAALKSETALYEVREADLLRKIAGLEDQLDYLLARAGGSEAMGEDYSLTTRVALLEEPVAPKRRLRPSRSRIVLAMGAAGFFLLCFWIVVQDQHRRLRQARPL
jgi:hypothetical protein